MFTKKILASYLPTYFIENGEYVVVKVLFWSDGAVTWERSPMCESEKETLKRLKEK